MLHPERILPGEFCDKHLFPEPWGKALIKMTLVIRRALQFRTLFNSQHALPFPNAKERFILGLLILGEIGHLGF